jgi:hypothetical protein
VALIGSVFTDHQFTHFAHTVVWLGGYRTEFAKKTVAKVFCSPVIV